MLRIDTYSGTMDELAAFLNSVWAHSYAGRMTYIRWTAQYLCWQLRLNIHADRRNLIAAYDGDNLAGVLLGSDYTFRTPARVIPGSIWSWLTIHPDYRGRGIAKLLDAERVRRLRVRGVPLVVSYRFVGSSHSQAEQPIASTSHKQFVRKFGFWIRVLQPARFDRWHFKRFEGFLGIVTGPFAPVPRMQHRGVTIRDYQPVDLEKCLQLVQHATQPMNFGIAWSRESLAHQLGGSSIAQSLILEIGGEIHGLINFHVQPFESRAIDNVGIIDLAVFRDVGSREQACLVDAALARMNQLDAMLAVKLRSGDVPSLGLLRNGFVPEKAGSYLVLQWPGEPVEVPQEAPMHLLWR